MVQPTVPHAPAYVEPRQSSWKPNGRPIAEACWGTPTPAVPLLASPDASGVPMRLTWTPKAARA